MFEFFGAFLDWFGATFTMNAFWPWFFVGLPAWMYWYHLRISMKKVPWDVTVLRKKYLSLQPPIAIGDERTIPIAEMYVYPIRGALHGSLFSRSHSKVF